MDQLWTVAKFSAVFNLDCRRVAKALATLDGGRDGARDVWPMAEGAAAIFADVCGQPAPKPLSESDHYWQLRHGVNLARDAIAHLEMSDPARKRMAQAAQVLWSNVLRLESRFED